MGTLEFVLTIANLFATLFMTGLIWFVQIVHYPLFAKVGDSNFPDYERAHAQRTTSVVFPVMTTELGTAFGLVWFHWENGPPWLWITLLGLAGFIWIITLFVSVPLHGDLSASFQAAPHRKLVRSNWLRTIGWSARSIIWIWILMGN